MPFLLLKMKGGIGMANYEKQVEKEAAYPIPISFYKLILAAPNEYKCKKEFVYTCNYYNWPSVLIYTGSYTSLPLFSHFVCYAACGDRTLTKTLMLCY